MAPHVEGDTLVESGYLPLEDSIAALKKTLATIAATQLGQGLAPSLAVAKSTQHYDDDEHDPQIISLSLKELQEIEDAVVHFEGSYRGFNRLESPLTERYSQQQSFPSI